MQKKYLLTLALFVLVPSALDSQVSQTRYIDNTVAACADVTGAGLDLLRPYCTLRYVSTIATPGYTYIMSSRRDGSGPVEFTRSGTATAPITYRGVGSPTIGLFTDVRDEDFQTTAVPGVFSLAGAPNGLVWQTYWPPIFVDDPNPSSYTMVDTDGPLQLVPAPDEATLATIEGTYRYDVNGLRVHPYGSRTPSVTATDFVVGIGRSMNVASKAHYNVFENFNFSYTGSAYSFQVSSSDNVFRNIKYQGVQLNLKGNRNTVENYSVTHVHTRDASGGWLWYERGNGTAVALAGWNHKLTNGHIFHNWNSVISTELATNAVIDGIRAHGSPNHCGVGSTNNVVVRNAVLYNCQDYLWMTETAGMVLEHVVSAGPGISVEAVNRALGPITVRNSILGGVFYYVRGLASRCTWERGSLIENNIFASTATIERCATRVKWPILTYQAKCEAGEFVDAQGVPDCATVRNNRLVTDWRTVLTGGMWGPSQADSWDVSLVPGSPAIDIGVSGTATDITGVPRPQGASCDAGVFETCGCPAFLRRPGM